MKFNWVGIIEILFPRSTDERLLEHCTLSSFLTKYQPQQLKDTQVLASFREHEIRAALHLNKFHNHPKAQKLLTELFRLWLASLPEGDYKIIPVPLSSKRERERGYNQVTVIAKKAVLTTPHIEVVTNLLLKTKHTPPQTTLAKAERTDNVANVFALNKSAIHADSTYQLILLDDVITTGSTLRNAKKTLISGGYSSIICVAFAH